MLEPINVVFSAISAAGLGYLLLSGKYVIGYPVFFKRVLIGLFLYAVTGLVGLVNPMPALHLVHAVSAVFVAAGCYSLVVARLEPTDDFRTLES